MNPASLVNEFRCFHVVAQEGVVAWNEGDIDGATFRMVAVLGSTNGIVQCLAPEAGVYPYRFAEMRPQRFKHLLAKLLEVVYFFRIDAVLYLFLLSGFAAKHFF